MARLLFDLGLLTKIDVSVLAMYCQAYARMVRAEDELSRQPEVIESDKGNLYQNPWYGVARTAARDVMAYGRELGMTPSARTRIAVEKSEGDTLADILFGS